MIPKRHHFLPQFYLRGFSREDFVWLYDHEKKQYRCQPIRNTAVIAHYYTASSESEEPDYSIESLLSQFEGRAKPVISKMENSETITAEERVDLAYFLALLFCRTPKFEREITFIADSFHKLLAKKMFPTVEAAAQLLKESGAGSDVSPESMFRFIHDEQFQIVGHRNSILGQSLIIILALMAASLTKHGMSA